MALVVRTPATRASRSPFRSSRIVGLLALWMTLAWHVPASSADGPNIWSIQLHGGTLAPLEAQGMSPMVGMRYCKHYTPHLYGGLLTGLASVSRSREQPAQGLPNVGTSLEVSHANASLVPVMGFLQVNLTDKFFLVPLVGFGAGYEWLSLSAKDGAGVESRTLFRNFAWEAYGGVALRVTRAVRVNGEVFYNGGSLERRVPDENQQLWLEAVHVNAVGARIGLDMDFE